MSACLSRRRSASAYHPMRVGVVLAFLSGCASAPEPAAVANRVETKPASAAWRLFDAALGVHKDELSERLVVGRRQWSTCEIRQAPATAGGSPVLESCTVPGQAEQPTWLTGQGQSVRRVRYVFVNQRLSQIEASFETPSSDTQFQATLSRLTQQFGQPVMQSSTEAVWQNGDQRAILRRSAVILEGMSGTL